MSFESWTVKEIEKILMSLNQQDYGLELRFKTREDLENCKQLIYRVRKKKREDIQPFTVKPNPQDNLSLWLVKVEGGEKKNENLIGKAYEKGDD